MRTLGTMLLGVLVLGMLLLACGGTAGGDYFADAGQDADAAQDASRVLDAGHDAQVDVQDARVDVYVKPNSCELPGAPVTVATCAYPYTVNVQTSPTTWDLCTNVGCPEGATCTASAYGQNLGQGTCGHTW